MSRQRGRVGRQYTVQVIELDLVLASENEHPVADVRYALGEKKDQHHDQHSVYNLESF
jgi:hypothetical protein